MRRQWLEQPDKGIGLGQVKAKQQMNKTSKYRLTQG